MGPVTRKGDDCARALWQDHAAMMRDALCGAVCKHGVTARSDRRVTGKLAVSSQTKRGRGGVSTVCMSPGSLAAAAWRLAYLTSFLTYSRFRLALQPLPLRPIQGQSWPSSCGPRQSPRRRGQGSARDFAGEYRTTRHTTACWHLKLLDELVLSCGRWCAHQIRSGH